MKQAAVRVLPPGMSGADLAAEREREALRGARKCVRCGSPVHKGRCKGQKIKATRSVPAKAKPPKAAVRSLGRAQVYEEALRSLESERDDIEAAIDGLRRLLGRVS